MKPVVDVCVLVYNRADVTLEFFHNILDHTTKGYANFWFLDNGSQEPDVPRLFRYMKRATGRLTFSKYRGRRCKFFQASENLMFSGGNNFLARKGKAPWLLFLNNDAFPNDSRWLEKLVEEAESGNYAAMGPTSNAVIGLQDVKWTDSLLNPPEVHATQLLSGFCFLIRRDIFEKLGGWDEQFDNGDEDLDLSIRVRNLGCVLGIHRGVYLYHMCSQSMQPWVKAKGETLEAHFAQTRMKLLAKHNERVQNDLWYWEHLWRPRSEWSKHGVLPNGYFFYPPGRFKDQTRAFYSGKPSGILYPDELHPGPHPRSAGSEPAPEDELYPRGQEAFEYHIGCLADGGFNVAVTEHGADCRLLDDGRKEARETFCGFCEERLKRGAAKDGHVRHGSGGSVRPAGSDHSDQPCCASGQPGQG